MAILPGVRFKREVRAWKQKKNCEVYKCTVLKLTSSQMYRNTTQQLEDDKRRERARAWLAIVTQPLTQPRNQYSQNTLSAVSERRLECLANATQPLRRPRNSSSERTIIDDKRESTRILSERYTNAKNEGIIRESCYVISCFARLSHSPERYMLHTTRHKCNRKWRTVAQKKLLRDKPWRNHLWKLQKTSEGRLHREYITESMWIRHRLHIIENRRRARHRRCAIAIPTAWRHQETTWLYDPLNPSEPGEWANVCEKKKFCNTVCALKMIDLLYSAWIIINSNF